MAWAELLRFSRKLIENSHGQKILALTAQQSDADIAAAGQHRHQLQADRRKDLLRQLSERSQEAASLAGDLAKAQERAARFTLLAPADGVVTDLQVHTVGAWSRRPTR